MIGTIELTFTKASGTFYCAKCAANRPFKHQTKRQFLTVYFIPLIPLQKIGEFIKCGKCQETFPLSATGQTQAGVQAAEQTQAIEMIRRVLVMIVAADNVVSDEELEAVADFVRQNDGPETTDEQILQEAARIRQSSTDAISYIRHVAQPMDTKYKELMAYHSFLAATAGGELSAERQALLAQLPGTIGIAESRFREIVVHAIDQ